jgi:hypothetical protein
MPRASRTRWLKSRQAYVSNPGDSWSGVVSVTTMATLDLRAVLSPWPHRHPFYGRCPTVDYPRNNRAFHNKVTTPAVEGSNARGGVVRDCTAGVVDVNYRNAECGVQPQFAPIETPPRRTSELLAKAVADRSERGFSSCGTRAVAVGTE